MKLIPRTRKSAVVAAAAAFIISGVGVVAGVGAAPASASTNWEGSVAATSSEALQPSRHCADYLVLGIRGSGEIDANRELYTFGNTIQRVRDLLHADLDAQGSNATIRQVYVDYDAKPLSVLVGDLLQGASTYGKGSNYFASSVDGFNKAERVLAASAQSCPNERWILLGYSQGSVIVDWLEKYDDLPGKWAGVLNIADPDNYGGRGSQGVGTAFSNGRIPKGIYATLYSDQIELPSDLRSVTYSYCVAGDEVCDFPSSFWSGFAIHGAYGSDANLPGAVSNLADSLTRN